MYSPNVVHKYTNADFNNYYYWQIYFKTAGAYTIDGDFVDGTAGLIMDLKVSSRPVYISGGTDLYLLGEVNPYLGPYPFTGTTSVANPVGTDYYYGNLGMGNNKFFN